jgi:hypothetical protein
VVGSKISIISTSDGGDWVGCMLQPATNIVSIKIPIREEFIKHLKLSLTSATEAEGAVGISITRVRIDPETVSNPQLIWNVVPTTTPQHAIYTSCWSEWIFQWRVSVVISAIPI